MNDWSFAQLCRLAAVSKDTINRLSPATACRALEETLPTSEKPVQILTVGDVVRSIHGVAYTRLWDVDLLTMLREFATDCQPPQQAGGSGGGGVHSKNLIRCYRAIEAGRCGALGSRWAVPPSTIGGALTRKSVDSTYMRAEPLSGKRRPDVVVMHEGPDVSSQDLPGLAAIREALESAPKTLVVRGHAHWPQPLGALENGTQILNVDARVVIFQR